MLKAMKQSMAVALCAALAAAGCATGGTVRVRPVHDSIVGDPSRAVMAEYVQKLPAGTPVRVVRAQGRTVRGTLVKATNERVFIQPATRLPEPIIEIPIDDVLSVTPQSRQGSNIGRAIGAGAAAGAGAALAVFLVIVAAFSD